MESMVHDDSPLAAYLEGMLLLILHKTPYRLKFMPSDTLLCWTSSFLFPISQWTF